MKKLLVFLLIMMLSISTISANDSVVLGTGDTLHPIAESVISIKKEVLTITYDYENERWLVEVIFTFNNPKAERTEKIAFVSHSYPMGNNIEAIQYFETVINGHPVAFSKEKILQDSDSYNDYYVSDILFPRGDSIVTHRYSFIGKETGMPNIKSFSYNLLTGKNWAGPIGEITIYVTFNKSTIIDKYNSFFLVEGEFRQDTFRDKFEKVISLKKGRLYFKAKNYIPKENIKVSFYEMGYVKIQTRFGEELSLYDTDYQALNRDELRKLSKSELRLLRNAIFAWHGYMFKDQDLNEYFSRFCWYWPDRYAKINLSKLESQNIDVIKEIERE